MKDKVNLSHCSTLAIWLTGKSTPPPVMYLFEVFLLGVLGKGLTPKKSRDSSENYKDYKTNIEYVCYLYPQFIISSISQKNCMITLLAWVS